MHIDRKKTPKTGTLTSKSLDGMIGEGGITAQGVRVESKLRAGGYGGRDPDGK